MKDLIKFLLGLTAFLAAYGTSGALEEDSISIGQALIQFGVILAGVIIGPVIAAIRRRKEE